MLRRISIPKRREKPQLPAPKKLLSTVEIKSTKPKLIQHAVREHCDWLFQQFPEVQSVLWFGSWVSGIPTPGSDVDLCLVLDRSDLPFRDRISKYLPDGFPVGVDIFAYTQEELQRLEKERPEWYQTIISGRVIKPGLGDRKPKK
ncbi:MAG: nucleotidyltransferase domain-containing protein [Spirochaetia bacterium]